MKLLHVLAVIFLLPPWCAHAINNPFKTDPRPIGIVSLGVASFVAGLYLLTKKPPNNTPEAMLEGLGAAGFISLGVLAILYANDIIVDFDNHR